MKISNCNIFKRSFTNLGLGFTFNNEIDDFMMKQDFRGKAFFPNTNRRPSLMKYASSKYALRVVIENNFEEVKRYDKTKEPPRNPNGYTKLEPTKVAVSLHHPTEPADMRSSSFKVPLGHSTTVYITPKATEVDEHGRALTEKQRNCRLNENSDSLDVFNIYTKAACLFECKMKYSMARCACIPWNYPLDTKEGCTLL